MAEKFKIIPLGGLNEIGKNMTVYEYGGDIIVVDCGMAFPGDDMYGIDCVIPDVSYLVKNRSRLRGLFITHGHEDHIGAIPYVLKQINIPIYCTRFTAGLIKLKLQEHGLASSTKLITVEPGQTVRAGKFQVEFIHVNHSIADSVAFAIHTRMGAVVHTGDFKIDSTPIDGEVIDLARFGELGKQGVLALLADSTNVERPGYTMSERAVGATFKRQFTGCDKRIIVTTFASNVHRIQQVLDAAAACGRKVAVTGRSMENIMKVSTELGYMKVPKNTLMDINRIKGLPLNQQVIVTTGSQGEEMSALYRMAFSTHKQVDIGPGDKVIISASGMCDAGRIRHHLKYNLWRGDSAVVFVGFQSPGTLGRNLLDGVDSVKLFGEDVAVRAKIVNFPGLSSHADHDHLVDWIKHFDPAKTTHVFVVHGDREVAPVYAETVKGLGFAAHAPQYTEEYDLIADKQLAPGYLPERKTRAYEGAPKATAAYQKLVQLGDMLIGLIRRSKGRDNKTLAAFADAIGKVISKFEF